jgi:hypothetical protein
MLTVGDAMKMTKWSLVNANFFLGQLNDIAELREGNDRLHLRRRRGGHP